MPASSENALVVPRTPGTTRIVLHGSLRRDFGGPFDWGCPTPASAIYALIRMKPGFREALEAGSFQVRRGDLFKGVDLDERMLRLKFGPQPEFHIIPVVAGAGKSPGGFIKAILGVALIAAAVATGFGVIGVAGTAGGVLGSGGAITGALGIDLGGSLFGVSAGALGLFGFGMLVGGIGDILSRQPKPPRGNGSFLLAVPQNVSQQGVPVPLAYGYPRVGSVVVSLGYMAVALNGSNDNDYNTGNSGGSFDNNTIP